MKNTQKWLLIVFTALTLAVVGTAVLAAGLPQETGSAALPKTTPERRTDIPMRTTDLSLFRLEKGSRALQIMKEVAACKKIRASEIEYYNLLPEEIKQLTHVEEFDIDRIVQVSEKVHVVETYLNGYTMIKFK